MKVILAVFILISFLFIKYFGQKTETKKLILAHNINRNHPVHRGLEDFVSKLSVLSKGKFTAIIYPNEILGREREVLELMQFGTIDLTKVSSNNLESFNPLWAVVNLPYIFKSPEHSFDVLDGEVGEILLNSLKDSNLQGLTFYDAGARSFYAHKPILKPEDIEGLKIRVMGSQSAIKMMNALGGSPTPMPYGEVYTGLQQKVIDGAENNVFALTTKKHGEVAKHYSLDEHAIMPDVLVLSKKLWESLSNQEKNWFKQAADYSKKRQREYWKNKVDKEMQLVQENLGVTIHHPEKVPFIKKVEKLHKELAKRGSEYKKLIDAIKVSARKY